MECKFCNKESKNLNSKVQHEIRCSLNPNRKIQKSVWTEEMRIKQSELMKKRNSNKERIWTQEMRDKVSYSSRKIQSLVWTDEFKKETF